MPQEMQWCGEERGRRGRRHVGLQEKVWDGRGAAHRDKLEFKQPLHSIGGCSVKRMREASGAARASMPPNTVPWHASGRSLNCFASSSLVLRLLCLPGSMVSLAFARASTHPLSWAVRRYIYRRHIAQHAF